MKYAAVAIALGMAVGLATGGRFRNLDDHRLAAWPLLVAGLVAQLASAPATGTAGLVLLLASYALLFAFALANLRLAGMALVVVGLGLNIATISVNGGMPVRPSAVVAAGLADSEAEVRAMPLEGKHHIERPDDRLMALSDVIPVRPLREVLSVGDLVMSAGVAWVLAALLRRPARSDG